MEREEFRTIITAAKHINSFSQADFANKMNECMQLAINHYLEHGDTNYLNKVVDCLSPKEKTIIVNGLKTILALKFDLRSSTFTRLKRKSVKDAKVDVENYKPFTAYSMTRKSGFVEIDGKLSTGDLYNFIADALVLSRDQFTQEQLGDLARIIERTSTSKEKFGNKQ